MHICITTQKPCFSEFKSQPSLVCGLVDVIRILLPTYICLRSLFNVDPAVRPVDIQVNDRQQVIQVLRANPRASQDQGSSKGSSVDRILGWFLVAFSSPPIHQ